MLTLLLGYDFTFIKDILFLSVSLLFLPFKFLQLILYYWLLTFSNESLIIRHMDYFSFSLPQTGRHRK